MSIADEPKSARRHAIVVSACLLGARTRYDGRVRLFPHLGSFLTRFRLLSVCPEVELGLGVPRESIELMDRGGVLSLIGLESGRDLTAPMQRLAATRAEELLSQGACGAITKARSPSCGALDAPMWGDSLPGKVGDGMFVLALRSLAPGLPIYTDEMLENEHMRHQFLADVETFASRPNRHT